MKGNKMLRKWLEKEYPDVIKEYDFESNQELQDWLDVFYEDVWLEYLEKIKPAKTFEALLIGEDVLWSEFQDMEGKILSIINEQLQKVNLAEMIETLLEKGDFNVG
jgi:hypothetical protein